MPLQVIIVNSILVYFTQLEGHHEPISVSAPLKAEHTACKIYSDTADYYFLFVLPISQKVAFF